MVFSPRSIDSAWKEHKIMAFPERLQSLYNKYKHVTEPGSKMETKCERSGSI